MIDRYDRWIDRYDGWMDGYDGWMDRYIDRYKEINSMESVPKIMEAEKSHDLPSANWTPRKATGIIQYKSEIMRIRGVSVISNPRAGEDRYPSSSRQGGKGSLLPCSFFLNFIYLYLFLAVLGLHCCFSLVASRVFSPVAVPRLLIVVASLVMEHGLWGARASVVSACGLSSWGTWAQ